jgi:hypothetical protein
LLKLGDPWKEFDHDLNPQQIKIIRTLDFVVKVEFKTKLFIVKDSVGDPDPDPQDLHVFGPPGSGSVSQRYGSGSGSGSFPVS